MIISSNGPQSVSQIKRHFEHGNIFLSPEEYQRENAWDLPQKQLLIDTIFRGMDIPKFYLWKVNEHTLADGYPDGDTKDLYRKLLEKKRVDHNVPDPYVYEVVDGQQRIRTILEFMAVKPPNPFCFRGTWIEPYKSLPDTPMAKGKLFDQLTVDQKITFEDSRLTVMILESATIDEIRDMFLRLQNGTPLNAQQKRDAMGSSIGREAKALSTLPFFQNSVSFTNASGNHHLVASQMLRLEEKDRIVSCTSRQLDKYYDLFRKSTFDTAVGARTKKRLNILGKIFPSKHPHLNQNYALSLYWLLSRISQEYEILEVDYPKIRENFENLDVARLKAMDRGYSELADKSFEDLSLAMSRGNTGVDGITTRHDIIGRFLFEGVELRARPGLDPTRLFSHEEKLILYHQSRGRCQLENGGVICGREIPFEDAAVDHIMPHSKGGMTSLVNGRIVYGSCNIARGNRDMFRPDIDCHLLPSEATAESGARCGSELMMSDSVEEETSERE